MSPAEAVLRYAGDFIPSWAGAIYIDLMPAVLVLILCVVRAAIRREGAPTAATTNMTVGTMLAALQMGREVSAAREGVPAPTPPEDDRERVAQLATDENVTPPSTARHLK